MKNPGRNGAISPERAMELRLRMVREQIERRGIGSPAILAALREVPREAFVESGFEEEAYEDGPLPIGSGQTISQPYIVALMLEAAELERGNCVLEIGTGSGYSAAVLSRIVRQVFTIERHEQLLETARRRLEDLHYGNISYRPGDGTLGWPEAAPFDAILVTAGAPEPPASLERQLAFGGRLVIPVGPSDFQQRLRRITRINETEYDEEDLGAVAFVPLIGVEGWGE
jgi:protein-L-isoaspartate(D-aspartate) O-methyltransferase